MGDQLVGALTLDQAGGAAALADCGLADPEPLGDLDVGQSPGGQVDHLPPARRTTAEQSCPQPCTGLQLSRTVVVRTDNGDLPRLVLGPGGGIALRQV